MDTSRLGRGELIAAVSAVLLFIAMFFGWFGISQDDAVDLSVETLQDLAGFVDDPNATSLSLNAWQAFSLIDIVLAITVIVAVGLALMTATSRSVNLPVAASALTAGLGILATLLILFRILVTPFDLGRELFVFVGLILAAGIAYGGWTSMQDEGTTFSGQADRLQSRGSDRPPGGGGTGTPPPPPPGGGGPGVPPGR